jgi:toxin YhaV
LVVNGWSLFYFHLFKARLDALEQEVLVIFEKDPAGFERNPTVKLLKGVVDNVKENVPRDPNHKDFRLGTTLGKEYTDWRRVKKHNLSPRYRLFFRFTSTDSKIVYAWLNDEHSIRKEGAKNDVYEVFKGMLRRGDVPNSLEALMKESSAVTTPKTAT